MDTAVSDGIVSGVVHVIDTFAAAVLVLVVAAATTGSSAGDVHGIRRGILVFLPKSRKLVCASVLDTLFRHPEKGVTVAQVVQPIDRVGVAGRQRDP